MGCMSSSQSNAVDRTDTTTIPTASADETALRAQFGDLSDAQFKALEDELRRIGAPGFSPFSLNLQDQQNVDAAFDSARSRFNLESRDYADTLAGGRGLRMSDTPIAAQALQRQGMGLADIESQRANAGLTLGLQGNDYRTRAALGLGASTPAAGVFSLQNYLQERMAQPTTHSVGFGSGTATPSGLTSAAQLASGIGSLGLGAAAAYGALGTGAATTSSIFGLGAGAVAI